MAAEVLLRGPDGILLDVTKEGAIGTVAHQHPPAGESVTAVPFWEWFANSAESNDMQGVGTLAAPLEYSVGAQADRDIYVKNISVEIADASATLSKFGNIAALTNGCTITWETASLGAVQLGGDLKSNWDFVRLAQGNPSFGDGTGAFRAGNVTGTSEGYIPIIDVQKVFGMPWGLRLRKGTNDRIVIRVRDTTTGVDAFDAVATGSFL